MVVLRVTSALPLLLLPKAWALQVTPDSPCSLECLDDATLDMSNPNSSNTYGSDISCLDRSYSTTTVGQKFKSCVNCLQNSTTSGSGENDQAWFLYNLRYALSSCLFQFSNTTDSVSTPCDVACGPLQQSLEDGNLIPSNETAYSYCSANQHAFMGSSQDKCMTCLQVGGTEMYLSNFIMALKAGCTQQPPAGTNIGIQGTVFSTTPINITYPGYKPNSSAPKKHKLSEGAIIGMAVGLAVLLAITIAVFFIRWHKRRVAKKNLKTNSFLHPRFGHTAITSPNNGAFGNPYAHPPVTIAQPFDPNHLSAKEVQLLEDRGVITKAYTAHRQAPAPDTWTESHTHFSGQPPHYSESPAIIPTHQAYVPSVHDASSPVASIGTENTYQLSSYSSTRSSPNDIIPPTRTTPKRVPPPIITVLPTHKSASQRRQSNTDAQPSQNQPEQHPQSYPGSESRTGLHERGQAGYGNVTESTIPSSRNASQAEVHSPPSRTASREGWRPGRNNTSRSGVGNVNASAVENISVPVSISGPMISHGTRFDFELAQRERAHREAEFEREPTWSPEENDSPEQWPGNY